MGKLTDARVRNAKPAEKPYKLADGEGLYLLVKPSGAKLWRYKYRVARRERTYSIGSYRDYGLAAARDAHREARDLVRKGIDPTQNRRLEKIRLEQSHANTFSAVAWEWFGKKEAGLSKVRRATLRRALERDLLPSLGNLPIREVTGAHLLKVLQSLENRPHVARIARQTASQVFQHAAATLRVDANPAEALKGAVRVPATKHAPTFEASEIPSFLRALEEYGGEPATKKALALLLHTFVRKGELLGARWEEFDWQAGLWRIPGQRMKEGKDHLVPLSSQVRDLLADLYPLTGGQTYLFPHRDRPDRPLSQSSLNMALHRMGVKVPPHGFRGTASTYLNEQGWSPDAIERQLAHVPRDQVRAAYNRAAYLEERRSMMQAWSDFLDASKGGREVGVAAEAEGR